MSFVPHIGKSSWLFTLFLSFLVKLLSEDHGVIVGVIMVMV